MGKGMATCRRVEGRTVRGDGNVRFFMSSLLFDYMFWRHRPSLLWHTVIIMAHSYHHGRHTLRIANFCGRVKKRRYVSWASDCNT